jgi:hypothetical protein
VKKITAGAAAEGGGGGEDEALNQLAESRTRSSLAVVADCAQRQLPDELARGEILLPLDMGEHDTSLTDREGVIDLRRRVAVIQRRCDQPCFETGEVMSDESRTIRHQRSDPVAWVKP